MVLAAKYFEPWRLAGGYSAVAAKHRQRIQNATFGQLMAAFEWCLKDFCAQLIDATDLFDAQLDEAKWVQLEKSRVLAQRTARTSIGAILIHPTQGWHETQNVQDRYSALFQASPVSNDEADVLDRLWILRHAVAHNAGYVTSHDAYRLRASELGEKSIRIDGDFLEQTWEFLTGIVRRLGDPVGTRLMQRWATQRASGSYASDEQEYRKLRLIVTVIESRDKDLPTLDESTYGSDLAAWTP
jgi:hypothetical protein